MEKNIITRQELYDLVWKESLKAISNRLGIPYNHLHKICAEFNVPIPPNGHWSKLLFGKPVEINGLPQDYKGVNEIKIYPTEDDISKPEIITLHKKSTVDLLKEDKEQQFKNYFSSLSGGCVKTLSSKHFGQ